MASLRQQRLSDEIRDLLAECFITGEVSDPRIKNTSVTAVKLSGDLQIATIYYRILGEEELNSDVQKVLEKSCGFFRTYISNKLTIRKVPSVRFIYDESVERGAHIEALLKTIR